MRKVIITLFLFPALILAGEKTSERKKEIAFSHNWTQTPNDQGFVQHGLLSNAWKALQEKNIRLFASDLKNEKDSNELTYVVIWNKTACPAKELFKKFPKKKLLLFMWDSPTVIKYTDEHLSHFHRIYTWDDSLVDNKKFFKFYYPELKAMIKDLPSFEEKKLVTQISSNKKSTHPNELYHEREAVIQFFEDKNDFDFYGFDWKEKGYKNYRGTLDKKLATLKNYRFNVCYENIHDIKGFVTEKIFDSFAAGSVPIYWGASNITDYIPKNCFIDRRDFKDFAAVYDYIRTMDKATYESYLKNIQDYLQSDKAKLFSQNMFEVIFLEAIRFP
jgi:alpha(1,3/1,4) fucosyltransferase